MESFIFFSVQYVSLFPIEIKFNFELHEEHLATRSLVFPSSYLKRFVYIFWQVFIISIIHSNECNYYLINQVKMRLKIL